jgi:hypothetical protein
VQPSDEIDEARAVSKPRPSQVNPAVLSGQPSAMTWKRIEIAEAEKAAWKRAFGQAARFLVDEGIDPELARALSNLGYKSTSVKAAGLEGRSDEDVLAFAKREDRIQ